MLRKCNHTGYTQYLARLFLVSTIKVGVSTFRYCRTTAKRRIFEKFKEFARNWSHYIDVPVSCKHKRMEYPEHDRAADEPNMKNTFELTTIDRLYATALWFRLTIKPNESKLFVWLPMLDQIQRRISWCSGNIISLFIRRQERLYHFSLGAAR